VAVGDELTEPWSKALRKAETPRTEKRAEPSKTTNPLRSIGLIFSFNNASFIYFYIGDPAYDFNTYCKTGSSNHQEDLDKVVQLPPHFGGGEGRNRMAWCVRIVQDVSDRRCPGIHVVELHEKLVESARAHRHAA
jgi:hypothetical protein